MTSMTLLPNFPQLIESIYPAQAASSRAPVSHLSSQTGKEGSAGLPEHTVKMPSWEEMEERLLLIFKGKSDFQQKPKKSLSCERSELLAQRCWSDQGQEEPAVTQQQHALILTRENPAKVQVPPRELNLSTRAPSRAACWAPCCPAWKPAGEKHKQTLCLPSSPASAFFPPQCFSKIVS